MVQGQFCGDCLYMRYGENVLEVEKKLSRICPVCRGICNCSICRAKKGWVPTGLLYKKVVNMGYKSVAHFLIQTRQQCPANSEDLEPTIISFGSKSEFKLQSAESDYIDDGDLKAELVRVADSKVPVDTEETLLTKNVLASHSFEKKGNLSSPENAPAAASSVSKARKRGRKTRERPASAGGGGAEKHEDSTARQVRRKAKSPSA